MIVNALIQSSIKTKIIIYFTFLVVTNNFTRFFKIKTQSSRRNSFGENH